MKSRSLQEHLHSGDHMARLAAHAKRLLQFQLLLEAVLPEALRPHARVANFRLGKLFIHASNSAVAAKIRQFGPSVARKLSTQDCEITEIAVKVQAHGLMLRQAPRHRPSLPGAEQKRGLASLEGSLPENSALKLALQRLLKTVKE
jgi:hypothetical protein